MKLLKQSAFVILAGLLLVACNGLKKMEKNMGDVQYRVNPNPLEVHNGEVKLNINGVFPEKYFDKKASLTLTPILTFEGGEVAFEPVTLQGEKVVANNKSIAYKAGGTFTYNSTVDFTEAMEYSDLILDVKGEKGNKEKVFERFEIGKGVIATPYMVLDNEALVFAPHNYTRVTKHQQKAQINYLVNSSAVRSSERRDDDIKEFKTFADTLKANENYTVKNVVIEAFASPEGELRRNEKLADNRGNSAKKEVKRIFRKKVEDGNDGFYNIIPKGEDWLGFKELMEQSTIEDKDLILRILKMEKDLVKREKEIRNLAKTFVEVDKQILPKLRRSQIVANYEIMGKSDEQIKALALDNPVDLDEREILYAAEELIEDAETANKVFESATEVYPDNEKAFNNYAVSLHGLGKMDEAMKAAEKSLAISDNEYAHNTKGVVLRQKGDLDAAKAEYNKAAGLGADVSYNMAIINVLRGEYQTAAKNVGSKKDFNAALAYYLNGDNAKALELIETAIGSDETGSALYLKAIINAKDKNEAEMINALKLAIAKNADWKAKAAQDRNFVFYQGKSAFDAVVK